MTGESRPVGRLPETDADRRSFPSINGRGDKVPTAFAARFPALGCDEEIDRAARLAYELGYGAGHEIGWAHGWAAAEREHQAHLGVLRPVLNQPTHAELKRRRGEA
jgi:hypothetical protein